MTAEDLCIGCSEPLIIAVEDSDEEIAAEESSVAPGIIDDVKLSCGHHYHWYSDRSPHCLIISPLTPY